MSDLLKIKMRLLFIISASDNFFTFFAVKCGKLDSEIMFPIFRLPNNDIAFLLQIKKNIALQCL